MAFSTKRQEKRIEAGGNLYRIFKDCHGREIRVYKHLPDEEISKIMEKPSYAIHGKIVDVYPATGKHRYSLKEVVQNIEEYPHLY